MDQLTGYCMKTKQKEQFASAVIEKVGNGKFMAKGETKEGNKMCAVISEANANEAIEKGFATKGF